MSKRGENWKLFSAKVLDHIENYTIPQYGDEGEDQITDWTAGECLKAVKKRLDRFGRNSRENQQHLDFLKMAHEVSLAAEKYDAPAPVSQNNRITIAQLRSALVGLVGVDGPEELEEMKSIIQSSGIPESEKAVTINAIHALLDTLPNALS
jgi:hypothetical protein